MWGGCLEGVGRLSRGCGEAVWRVWEGYLEDVGRQSRGYGVVGVGRPQGEAIWRV